MPYHSIFHARHISLRANKHVQTSMLSAKLVSIHEKIQNHLVDYISPISLPESQTLHERTLISVHIAEKIIVCLSWLIECFGT